MYAWFDFVFLHFLGVIIFNCKHKNLLGFQYMVQAEGPRFLHHNLYCRFQVAPSVVQYDNGMVDLERLLYLAF